MHNNVDADSSYATIAMSPFFFFLCSMTFSYHSITSTQGYPARRLLPQWIRGRPKRVKRSERVGQGQSIAAIWHLRTFGDGILRRDGWSKCRIDPMSWRRALQIRGKLSLRGCCALADRPRRDRFCMLPIRPVEDVSAPSAHNRKALGRRREELI